MRRGRRGEELGVSLERRITLRGVGGQPVLDGEGKGTVLDLRAGGVVIENLACRNSGKSGSAFELWGDAGIAVHGDRATISKVRVTGNDWGVLFFERTGSVLEYAEISDNENDGVRIMRGRNHRIAGCSVNRSGTGISFDALYPVRDAPIMGFGNPVTAKDFVEKKARSILSQENVVRENELAGNAFYGIVVTGESHHNKVEGNRVFRTGKERLVTRNAITANRVCATRIGLLLISADENRLTRNRVADHSEFGVRIGLDDLFKQASIGNLVAVNFLTGNPVNAHDSSGRLLTAPDLEGLIDRLSLPQEIKRQMARNPAMRAQMLKAYLTNLTPGTNQWDDGTLGNHDDDFDAREEGFVDGDSNGIPEGGKPIPGGPAVDYHSLGAALAESRLEREAP
ncbi:MAG TPA: NosD domain-containing protein [Verrucomicrobiales bacterium]|nr:NosD domain-containing protein [Verrucomicrobiales bacterium]